VLLDARKSINPSSSSFISSSERKEEQPTKEQVQVYKTLLESLPQEFVLGVVSQLNLKIRARSMRRLLFGQWIDEEVINTYCHLLTLQHSRVGLLTSHFMERLQRGTEEDLRAVNSWSSTTEIIGRVRRKEVDTILVPIHLSEHWLLASISTLTSTCIIFDSLASPKHKKAQRALTIWLQSTNYLSSSSSSSLPSPPSSSQGEGEGKGKWSVCEGILRPHQDLKVDTSNCGTFVCHYAESVCNRKSLDYIRDECLTGLQLRSYRDKIGHLLISSLPLHQIASSSTPIRPISSSSSSSTRIRKRLPETCMSLRKKPRLDNLELSSSFCSASAASAASASGLVSLSASSSPTSTPTTPTTPTTIRSDPVSLMISTKEEPSEVNFDATLAALLEDEGQGGGRGEGIGQEEGCSLSAKLELESTLPKQWEGGRTPHSPGRRRIQTLEELLSAF
jgi:hypothetical protein